MYHFARTPRWLAGHALAGVLLVIFLIAGFWQLSRHNEVRERNSVIAERQAMPPLDEDRFFDAMSDTETIDQLEYRSVSLAMVDFDWDESVLIRNRSLGGVAGCHLALPAETASTNSDESYGVLVVAGWLPEPGCGTTRGSEAGSTDVIAIRLATPTPITGRIRTSQERGLLGPTDPAEGQLSSLARVDVERIERQTTLDLVPVYVERIDHRDAVDIAPVRFEDVNAMTPTGETLAWGEDTAPDLIMLTPVPLPPPELDAGPHLGYTLQWFSFALVAIVGYTLVLRHQARRGESEQIADD
ncbi:SURF1 family protein [Candidatus Poriferisodalis sp.]|uniref:SURF1 family protein n=1 Tax=Candidatus Poriferisodalis sp. TaxID=3101277 RepID=UPI003C6F6509